MSQKKHIIITGVSSGIGKQLVYEFLKEDNCSVIGISRNEKLLEELYTDTSDLHAAERLHLFRADISTPDGIESIIRSVNSLWRHADVLINNAGKLINKPFSDITLEEWNSVYATNVFGPAQLIRSLLPILKKPNHSPPSHIVNITSMGGIQGSLKFPGLAAYSSSKGALIGLTECLAEELKPMGIRTNALALGSVDTEMFNEAFPQFTASKSVVEMASYIASFALKGASLFNGKTLQVSDSTP